MTLETANFEDAILGEHTTDKSVTDAETISQSEAAKQKIDQSASVSSRPRRKSICVSSLFSLSCLGRGG